MYTLIIKDIFNKDHVFPNKNIEECLPLKEAAEQYVKQFLAATIISADGQIISKYVPEKLNHAVITKGKREDCIVKPPKQKDNIKSNKIGKKVNATEPKNIKVYQHTIAVPKDSAESCIGVGSVLSDIKCGCKIINWDHDESKTDCIKNDDSKICEGDNTKSQDETPNDFWSNLSNMPELVNMVNNNRNAPDTKRINFKDVLIIYLDYVIDHCKNDSKYKRGIPYIVVVKEWLQMEKQDLHVLFSNLIKVKMPAA